VNTGLAVASALKNADATANKQVFLADFITTTRQIIASLEKQTGERFSVEQKASGPEMKAFRHKYDAGVFDAMFPILAMTFGADVDVGYDFETEQEVWNSRLGLPKVELDQVVQEAFELANQTL
jgi:hypothetical protein